MTTPYLLDANAVIALSIAEHEHHQRAATWGSFIRRMAICPIVEGALVRFLLRIGERADTASALLTNLHHADRVEFWEDSLSYSNVDLRGLIGHRQATDAYLCALAGRHSGRLATFDRGLAATWTDVAFLIP